MALLVRVVRKWKLAEWGRSDRLRWHPADRFWADGVPPPVTAKTFVGLDRNAFLGRAANGICQPPQFRSSPRPYFRVSSDFTGLRLPHRPACGESENFPGTELRLAAVPQTLAAGVWNRTAGPCPWRDTSSSSL